MDLNYMTPSRGRVVSIEILRSLPRQFNNSTEARERKMIHQRKKDFLFGLINYITRFNYYYHKLLASRHLSQSKKLNVGSGDRYIPNFINIDANILKKPDIWLDLRNGIPFPTRSIESIYASHLLEHFYPNELDWILEECYRVLIKGGGIRVIVPNLKSAIKAYVMGKKEFFLKDSNYWNNYKSLGGCFSNYILCDGQHRGAFDFDYMYEVLTAIGFKDIIEQGPLKSLIYGKEFLHIYEIKDNDDLPRFLYIEAFKKGNIGHFSMASKTK